MKKYALNYWKAVKLIKPQHNDEKGINAMVAKVEKIN